MALTRSALVKRHKAIVPQEKQPMLIVLVGAGLVKFVTGSFLNAGVIWG